MSMQAKVLRVVVVVASALAAIVANAQVKPSFKRFLVPLVVQQPIPGAHGSSWVTETWFSYAGTERALMAPAPFCFSFECSSTQSIPPQYPPLKFTPDIVVEPAILVHVETTYAPLFSFQSRVRDLTRNRDSAGTEIPVVAEDRMSSAPLRLLNIPTVAGFRNTLRVYGLPETVDPEVEIRYFRMEPFGENPNPVPDKVVLLRADRYRMQRRPPTPVDDILGINGLFPSRVEIGNFQAMPEIAGESGIWIEVVPITAGLRIWAFVSITNDTTQQVTIVSP